MYPDCHAMLGWTIGNLVPGDARLRRWATAAAILPDIDGVPVIFGVQYYAQFHHTFGHNVFLWAAVSALAGKLLRSWKAAMVVFICFGSHLLTDAYFTGINQYLLWPVSSWPYSMSGGYALKDPINLQLTYVGLLIIFLLALIVRRTPMELFSPKLDRLLVSVISRRRLRCGDCNGKTNQNCVSCGMAVCWRHAVVTRGFQVMCPACVTARQQRKSSSDVIIP